MFINIYIVVYFDGPDKYHASYSVRVRNKDMKDLLNELENGDNENNDNETECFSQFSALMRINETASKEVMICYVIYDSQDELFNLNEPSCVGKFHVMESLIERWVPKENRDHLTESISSNNASSTNNKPNTSKNAYEIDSSD